MNPQMLTLLRESRGMSGLELARLSGVPQPMISKMENGVTAMDPARVQLIADALQYPLEVFSWDDQVYGFGSAAFYHRKQQSLAQGTLRMIQAEVNLMRMRVRRLLRSIEVDARFTVPFLDVEELGGPERVAQAVRAHWLLPMGPVKDLMAVLEQAGVVVTRSDFGSPRISAISFAATRDCPAIVVLNDAHAADRERFTAAHELGHLVMHIDPTPTETAEQEADAFASEFLMPAREIKPQLKGITLQRTAQLKAVWKVSMAALIRRARDLGAIDDSRYKSLQIQLSQHGWRKSEPVQFEREDTSVIEGLLDVHYRDHGYTNEELATVVGLRPAELPQRFPSTAARARPAHGLRIVGP